MTIELITPAGYENLVDIYSKCPALTLQNKGYEYINKSNLSEDDKAKIKEIEAILKKSISGFVSFTNFRLSKTGELEIRFQYHYDASFTGVGYVLADELLNGFRETVRAV